MPSSTNWDNSLYKSQVVKVYSPTGLFIDVLRDAPYLTGFTEAVNAATTSLTIDLPRRLDAYDGANMPGSRGTMALGNIVKYYLYGPGLPTNGLLRYQGIIDTIQPSIDESGGESLKVTITPYSSLLGDHAIIGPLTYGTVGVNTSYIDSGSIFATLLTTTDPITGLAYASPFSLDGSNILSGVPVMTQFQNQTLLSALTSLLLLSPADFYFRMNDTLLTISYNLFPSVANYTLILGQHISSMDYSFDNTPRKNMCAVQGNGTIFAKAVGSSVGTIGERTYFKADNRIVDQNTAQTYANGLLNFYDRAQIRTTVKIPDYRGGGGSGLGYDIEKFRVGQTVQILDGRAPKNAAISASRPWGQFVWGSDTWGGTPTTVSVWGQFVWGQSRWGYGLGSVFNTPVPIVAINYDFHVIELELGFRQPTMLRALFDLESRFNDTALV